MLPPHLIIHATSTAAASVGALSPFPGSDAPVLMSLQSAMILAIAGHYGVQMTQMAAAEMVLTFNATMTGRTLSQVLIGWIPGLGNAANAATAAAITEAVGWMAVRWFEQES